MSSTSQRPVLAKVEYNITKKGSLRKGCLFFILPAVRLHTLSYRRNRGRLFLRLEVHCVLRYGHLDILPAGLSAETREKPSASLCGCQQDALSRCLPLIFPMIPRETLIYGRLSTGEMIFISPISLPSSPPYDTFITLTI